MRTTGGAAVAPHRNLASHGMVVKQEPDDQLWLQGRPVHPIVGVQPAPPLPTRTVYNYRVTGRGNAPGFHPPAPAPTRQVDFPLRNQGSRRCAGVNCTLNLPMDYPHLRCRECRARNVPRRPELSTIMTPAQLLARDRKLSAVPPLPSRVMSGSMGPVGRKPPPLRSRHPPPPLPSRFQRPHLQVQVPAVQRTIPPADPLPFRSALRDVPCKVEPDIDADIALQALLKPSSDDDGDSDIVELEYPEDLSYPESGNATPVDVKPPPFPSPALPSTISPSANKRRKVSHIPEPDLPPPTNGFDAPPPTLPPSISSAAPPLPYKPSARSAPTPTAPPLPTRRPPAPHTNAAASSSSSSLTSKLCSSLHCTNALPTTSPATRCMSCISKAWKSKRSVSVSPSVSQAVSASVPVSASTPVLVSVARSRSGQSDGKDGKRKAVSWADRPNEEQDEFDFRDTTRVHSSGASVTRVDAGGGNVKGWDSDLTELSQSESEGGGGSGDEDGGESGDETEAPTQPEVSLTPVHTGLKIRIPPRSGLKSEGASSPPTRHKPTLSPTTPADADTVNPPPPTSSPTPGDEDDGMSSPDLSTPTTTPDLEPESQGEVEQVDKATGLRMCSAPRCTRTLPRDYHWKSCVVCRASARGYQRKRQGLQGRHTQLDLELRNHLKENGIGAEDDDGDGTSPPLETKVKTPKPRRPAPIKVDIEPFDDEDRSNTLVPGARVCTAKDCSFVVPSADEYHWKLCNRCRTRSKESKTGSRRASSLKQANKEYRHEIAGPEALAMKRENGRCLSSDCGMLVGPESKYPYCRQCRLQDWRLKRRHLRMQAILAAEKRTVTPSPTLSTPLSIKIPALRNRLKALRPPAPPPPRPPTPYPEYKNLAGLLTNFRILAKNFFDAQTMHFAHQPPGSSPPLSIFIFDGEFTLVAPDLHLAQKRKAQVERTVGLIQREVGAAAMLQYSEKKWLTMFNHGIVTRFVCWRHPVRVRVPVPVAQEQTSRSVKAEGDGRPGVTKAAKGKGKEVASTQDDEGEPRKFILKEVRSYHRVMEGELEVSVFADKSHPFIPGERTVVRVRLVG